MRTPFEISLLERCACLTACCLVQPAKVSETLLWQRNAHQPQNLTARKVCVTDCVLSHFMCKSNWNAAVTTQCAPTSASHCEKGVRDWLRAVTFNVLKYLKHCCDNAMRTNLGISLRERCACLLPVWLRVSFNVYIYLMHCCDNPMRTNPEIPLQQRCLW